MTNTLNSRGSEWRKWDLHVHTPASHNFIGTWEQFYTSLKDANCDVIRINDYFSVDGYKKIKKAITENECNIENKAEDIESYNKNLKETSKLQNLSKKVETITQKI